LPNQQGGAQPPENYDLLDITKLRHAKQKNNK